MPSDLIKRVNLDLIYPPFLHRCLAVLAACRARGHDFYWISGTRLYDEQDKLRKLYLAGKGGKAARPGLSAHQYGLAGDFTLDKDLKTPGLQPDWNAKHYAILGEEAAKAGLLWGARYSDSPHLNYPGYESASQLAPLRKLWLATPGVPFTRLKKVWKAIDAKQV